MKFHSTHWTVKWLAIFLITLTALSDSEASEIFFPSELEPVLRDLCNADVVLLGEEPGHTSGQAVLLKSVLTAGLIDRCGFVNIYFESSFYEFLEFERMIQQGTATRTKLADAAGGLWSTANEFQQLLNILFDKASSGSVRLAGLDPQVGGANQDFTQHELPDRLASHLTGQRRVKCKARLEQLTNWDFDDLHPYDDPARAELRGCLKDIQSAISLLPPDDQHDAEEQMANSLARYLDMSSTDSFNVRDRAMYENFLWQRKRATGSKSIIWCATTHATKRPAPFPAGRLPLGTHLYSALGEKVESVAFTAIGGTYGRPGKKIESLESPPAHSLEAKTTIEAEELVYLNATALHKLGRIESRALGYKRPQSAAWDELFNGIIVIRTDTPLQPFEHP